MGSEPLGSLFGKLKELALGCGWPMLAAVPQEISHPGFSGRKKKKKKSYRSLSQGLSLMLESLPSSSPIIAGAFWTVLGNQ